MKDYRPYSYWLESCGDDLTPRPPLDGSTEVDVAILGAGFTGLWTAYHLLGRDPSLRVAVLEREIAGFGASGRNGGWCTSGFPIGLAHLELRYGREAAREIQAAMDRTVDAVGRTAAEEGIDAHFRKGGELLIARGRHQQAAIEHEYAVLQRLGMESRARLLDAAAVADRLRVAGAVGALQIDACAVIHPGRLARGLARAVERRGGHIYERTAVSDFTTGARPSLVTARGTVRASSIVLAGEAYLTQLAALHRQSIPVYSLIVLTEPLSEAQWKEIGWQHHDCVASARYTVDYLSRTMDGRILFGGRGAPYHFGSRIQHRFDRHAPTHELLRRMVVEWFPMLKGVRFTHAWGGPLGIARDWMPTIGFNRRTNVATARGYVGQGVATTNLSGRLLADLITGRQTALTSLAMVNHRSPSWEPEPLRWLGVRFVQRGLQRVDARAERTGKPPTGGTLAERLGGH